MKHTPELAAYAAGLAEGIERASHTKPAHPDGRLLMERGMFGKMRCFVDCPAEGYRREVAAIEYQDGGRLVFPHDFSSKADPKSIRDAMPKGAAPTGEDG